METILSALGLAIGLLAALFSFVVPVLSAPPTPAAKRPRISGGLWLALGLVLGLFLLTLPTTPPFSPGQRLGWGFLIGGAAALIAALACCRLVNPGRAYWPYASGVALSLALSAVSLAALLFEGDPGDALIGCAFGFTVVAGVLRTVYGTSRAPDLFRGLEAGAVLAAMLAASVSLAIFRFDRVSQRGWWACPLALAAFWLLGQLISYSATARKSLLRHPAIALAISAAVSAILAVVLGSMLGLRLEPARPLLWLLLAGVFTAALIIWLTTTAHQEPAAWPLWIQVSGLAVLLTIFLLVVSFKLFTGLGAAVALLAAWAVVAPALAMGGMTARLPLQALMIGANFLLLQLFLERGGTSAGEAEMALHYTLVGVVLGVLLPAVYSSLLLHPGVARTFVLGVLGALSPLVVLALWGPDAILGLLVGLVARQGVGVGFVALGAASERWTPWQAPTGLLSLGMGLAAAQFSRSFASLYQIPVRDKVYLAGAIGLLLVLAVTALWLARLLRLRWGAPADIGAEI
jgi:hypothetical protein